MKKLNSFFLDLRLNLTPSVLAFYMMRLTGIALALFLVLHIFSISRVTSGIVEFNELMNSYKAPFWVFGEYMVFLAVIFHAANGVRVMVGDFFDQTRSQKKILYLTMCCAAALAIAGIPVFFFGVMK